MTEDFPITSYVHACPLCQAAKEANAHNQEPEGLEEAAKKHGVTVALLKRRLGLSAKRHTWDPTEVDKLTEDVDNGMTFDEIAERWNMSKSRVAQLISKFEIDPGPGRRARARRDAVRFREVFEAVDYTFELEPNLTIGANFAWCKTMNLVEDLTFDEVADVFHRFNLEPGDLDAMPTDAAAIETIEDQRSGKKKTRPIKDVQLPDHGVEHIEISGTDSPMVQEAKASIALDKNDDGSSMTQPLDDVVTVPQRSLKDWLKLWMAEEPHGTVEDYKRWSEATDGAPTTDDMREEFGSWRNAKAAALE
jgi:hypothetical protein